MEQAEREAFLAELKRLGIDEVRVLVETNAYGSVSEKGPLAREWLLRKQLALASEREARSNQMTKRAHTIAIIAASAAMISATAAMISSVASLIVGLRK
jgi:hypothetical protein